MEKKAATQEFRARDVEIPKDAEEALAEDFDDIEPPEESESIVEKAKNHIKNTSFNDDIGASIYYAYNSGNEFFED